MLGNAKCARNMRINRTNTASYVYINKSDSQSSQYHVTVVAACMVALVRSRFDNNKRRCQWQRTTCRWRPVDGNVDQWLDVVVDPLETTRHTDTEPSRIVKSRDEDFRRLIDRQINGPLETEDTLVGVETHRRRSSADGTSEDARERSDDVPIDVTWFTTWWNH